MPFITTHNAKVFYQVSGSGEPLVLIPGLDSDHTMWGEVITELAAQYQVIAIDNRGAGRTEYDGDFTIDDIVADIYAVLQELNLKQIYLLGHSMGGYIVQQFISKHQAMVSKLILLSTSYKRSNVSDVRYEVMLEMLDKKIGAELLVKSILPWLYGDKYLAKPEHVQQHLHTMLYRKHGGTIAGLKQQVAIIVSFDDQEILKNITCPVGIIHGDEDRVIPLPRAQEMAEDISDSRLIVLPGVGHMPQVEVKDQFLSALKAFLDSA